MQEKPLAIDPRVRLCEHSSRSQGPGAQRSLFSSFLLLPSHSPGWAPWLRSREELTECLSARWSSFVCAPFLQILIKAGAQGVGRPTVGPRLLSKSLEVRKVELECEVSRDKSF